MTNNVRISTVILLAAFMLSIAGCRAESNNPVNEPSQIIQQMKQKIKRTPVTLTVEVFDRANAPLGAGAANDNYVSKLIQDVWGTPNNVTLKYVSVPRSQEESKLTQMMASGTAPNIVFTYSKNQYLRLAGQGVLTDLTDSISKTKYLKAMVDKNKADLLYHGEYFAVAAYRPLIDRHMSFIRTDWLEKLGLKTPTTTEEWYTVMKAFKEKDPGGLGGNVIPFGMRSSIYVDNHDGAQQLIWSFVKASDEEQQTLPYLLLPGFKDGVRFVNKLFNEGLIDPEFSTDKQEVNFKANIMNGRTGFVTVDVDAPGIYDNSNGDLLSNLQNNVPGAKLEPVECFRNSDGMYLKSVYPHYGLFIMIPKTSTPEQVQAAVDYLDWQSSDEGLKLIRWGEEGINYSLKDGIPSVSSEQKALNDKDRFNSSDFSLMWNGNYNINENLLYKQIELSDQKWGTQKVAAMKMSIKDGFRDYNANPVFDTTIDVYDKYKINLDQLYLDGLANLIKARPSDFDRIYDALVIDYLKNGGQEIIDLKKTAYEAKSN